MCYKSLLASVILVPLVPPSLFFRSLFLFLSFSFSFPLWSFPLSFFFPNYLSIFFFSTAILQTKLWTNTKPRTGDGPYSWTYANGSKLQYISIQKIQKLTCTLTVHGQRGKYCTHGGTVHGEGVKCHRKVPDWRYNFK